MIYRPLLKQLIKSNVKSFAVFTGVLCALIAMIMTVFDAETMKTISDSSVNMPFNPLGNVSTLMAFIGNQYFGNFALLLPMIYLISTGIRLVAAKVDKGDMASSLSAPVTRSQVTLTSAFYLSGSLVLMFALMSAVGAGVAAVVQPDVLDVPAFLRLSFGACLLQLAISGIVFCASCVFSRSRQAMAIGAGLPVLFFVANLLSGMSRDLEVFKYVSLITLFDAEAIAGGENVLWPFIALAAVTLLTYAAGIKVFKEKDLPL